MCPVSSVTRAARARIRDAETLCCCTAPPYLCHLFFFIYMYTYTHIGLFLLFFLCTVTGLFCRCFPLPSLAVTALVFNFLQIVRVRVCVCVRGRYRMLPPIVRGYCVKWGGDSLILVGCCCWGRGGGCSSCGHCACVPPSRASLMSAAVVTTATEKGMVEGLQTGVGHVCGPAVHRVAARQSLMGLWGHGCARPRGNSIHTRVYISKVYKKVFVCICKVHILLFDIRNVYTPHSIARLHNKVSRKFLQDFSHKYYLLDLTPLCYNKIILLK